METYYEDKYVIECKDIVLRPFQKGDEVRIYELSKEPEIKEFLPDWTANLAIHKEWIEHYEIPENMEYFEAIPNLDKLSHQKALRYAIVLKETNIMIGWIVSGIKEELPKPNREIGYAISNQYSNCGYATQAVKAFISFLFQETNLLVINATARDYNISSNRVIQKSGFIYQSDIKIEGFNYHWYLMNKDDIM